MDSVGVLFFLRDFGLRLSESVFQKHFVYPVVFFERFWYLIVGEF